MTKHTSQFALAAGLLLAAIAPRAQAAPIQSLDPAPMSISTFNSLYTPLGTAPAMSSVFDFAGAPSSGIVQSQVFQGTGAAAGTYAYAYQIDVNSSGTTSSGDPAHVDSASFNFGATPLGTDLTNSGHTSYSYVVTDGQVGNLNLPQAAPGGTIQSPNEFSWQAGTNTGVLRAKFENAATQAPALNAGANSATFIVISKSPQTQQFVNLQSADPQTTVNGGFTSVYVANGGKIQPLPIPEPTTVLAWAGMLGGLALVRRVRKGRAAIVA